MVPDKESRRGGELKQGQGTILFTGATAASLRGSAGFVNLAAPKFALRAPRSKHGARTRSEGRAVGFPQEVLQKAKPAFVIIGLPVRGLVPCSARAHDDAIAAGCLEAAAQGARFIAAGKRAYAHAIIRALPAKCHRFDRRLVTRKHLRETRLQA